MPPLTDDELAARVAPKLEAQPPNDAEPIGTESARSLWRKRVPAKYDPAPIDRRAAGAILREAKRRGLLVSIELRPEDGRWLVEIWGETSPHRWRGLAARFVRAVYESLEANPELAP